MQASEIAKQIEGCSAFFASQQALLGVDKAQTCAGAMCSSIAKQIGALGGLVVHDASVISSAIANSGFSATHKAELAHVVAEGASKAIFPELKARKQCQTWAAVETYLTKDDWTTLQGTGSGYTKVAVVVDRLYKAGLSCPSEATVKHMVALVASVHCPDAAASELHDMVLQVKNIVKGQPGLAVVLQHLKTFPATPADLPEASYKHAYSDANPCNCSLPRFQEVLSRVPLRITNKAIGGASGSADALGIVASQQHKPSAMEVMNMLWQQMQVHQQQQQRSTPLVKFTEPQTLSPRAAALVDSPAVANRGALAIMDKASDSQGTDSQSLEKPDQSACKEPGPNQVAAAAASEPRPRLPPPPQATVDQIAELERLAGGFDADGKPAASIGVAKAAGKKKAASKQTTKKPAGVVKTTVKQEPTGRSLQLGCTKCRGSPIGCEQCRNPSYGGRRFTRK